LITPLIDTDGKDVARTTEIGVVVAGVEYPVDCIIYASGFEVGTPLTQRAVRCIDGGENPAVSNAWTSAPPRPRPSSTASKAA